MKKLGLGGWISDQSSKFWKKKEKCPKCISLVKNKHSESKKSNMKLSKMHAHTINSIEQRILRRPIFLQTMNSNDWTQFGRFEISKIGLFKVRVHIHVFKINL